LLTMAHNVLIVYEELHLVTVGRLLTLVVVPLGMVLAPQYGVVGLAIAYGSARVVAGIWATFWGWQRIGLQWPWRFTVRVGAASLVMGGSLIFVQQLLPRLSGSVSLADRLWSLPLYGVVTVGHALLFLLFFRWFGGLEAADRAQLANMKLPFKALLLRVL
ncbi:MAG: hypothetical protein RLZZ297_1478, partial [Chloroflexota bacterium]